MRISDWSSDVCSSDLADRPEAGIIAQAEARPIAHAGKAGKAAGVKLSCVEEGDDAEIAEADTRLYGRFGQAAAADRIVVQVFGADRLRSEEHTSELQSLMHISYAVFCLKKKK